MSICSPTLRTLTLAMAVAVCGNALAQERAALGNVEAQMTWSALNGQIAAFNDKVNGLNSRVDQVVFCAKKGMVYAPGAGDADGCYQPATAPSVTTDITNLKNQMGTANTNITNTTNLTNAVYNCNRSGLVFNGSSCVTPASSGGLRSCAIQTTYGSGSKNGMSTSCPSGYNYTGSTGGSDYGTPVCTRVVCS